MVKCPKKDTFRCRVTKEVTKTMKGNQRNDGFHSFDKADKRALGSYFFI